MDGLADETLDTARETRSGKVGSCIHNPVQETADTVAEETSWSKNQKNKIEAHTPAPRSMVAGRNSVLSHRDVEQGSESFRVNNERIFRKAGYQFPLEIGQMNF